MAIEQVRQNQDPTQQEEIGIWVKRTNKELQERYNESSVKSTNNTLVEANKLLHIC